jgi:hypothetical protein
MEELKALLITGDALMMLFYFASEFVALIFLGNIFVEAVTNLMRFYERREQSKIVAQQEIISTFVSRMKQGKLSEAELESFVAQAIKFYPESFANITTSPYQEMLRSMENMITTLRMQGLSTSIPTSSEFPNSGLYEYPLLSDIPMYSETEAAIIALIKATMPT